MKKAFCQMSGKRLEQILERYRKRLVLVTNWTPRAKNLYNRFVTILNELADRKEQNPFGMSVSERSANGLLEEDSLFKVKLIQPWKLKQSTNGKKENATHHHMGTKETVGKGNKTNSKKLQDQNRTGSRATKNIVKKVRDSGHSNRQSR